MMNLTIDNLQQKYRDGEVRPRDIVRTILSRCKESNPEIWIYLLTEDELAPYLDILELGYRDDLPLYGIPFAIKDNIDLAGIPTTAGCPEYAYTPRESAFVVQQLIDGGAIPIGKTNLDQFATGLVGTRSPHGPCRNSFNEAYISGGSSSGSSVAVAKGLCSFSLGTDTAGSGRVPAAFNNILGIKPSKGLLSTKGVIPACRSLDCVSIFSLCAADASRILNVASIYDEEDPFARKSHQNIYNSLSSSNISFTYGVPRPEQLEFFGNDEFKEAFAKSLEMLDELGGQRVEIDYAPFLAAARLLYDGPWVAERTAAVGPFLESNPEVGDPVVREIICSTNSHSAIDLFEAMYSLQGLKKETDTIMDSIDVLVTPTAGTCYTLEQVLSDPIRLNSNLGYYTNFMNLLDYCAVSIPTLITLSVPFGITVAGKAFQDEYLVNLGSRIHLKSGLPMGCGAERPQKFELSQPSFDEILLAVCGAHLKGYPLHSQLVEGNARFVRSTKTSACYQMFALQGAPPKPGLIRDQENGGAIEVEVYALSAAAFGQFTANIPHPLGIGKLELSDGSWVPGFIAVPLVAESGKDITRYGGWRAYLSATYNFYVPGS